jgi:DNA-binding transcriptional ArsR family regulator
MLSRRPRPGVLTRRNCFDNLENVKTTNHARTVARLAALAQETRLALFRQLVEAGPEGMTPGVLAERLAVAGPTLSFHLKELARAGLIRAEQQGRYVVYTADFAVMNGLVGYLTENCCRTSCDSDCTDPPSERSKSCRRKPS